MSGTGAAVKLEAPLEQLVSRVAARAPWPDVVRRLSEGRSVDVEGLWGSAGALAAAVLTRAHPAGRLVVLVPQPDQVEDFADELEAFSGVRPWLFPACELPGSNGQLGDSSQGQRLETLKRLARGPLDRPLVASLPSLLTPVPSVRQLRDQGWTLRRGESLEVDRFCRWLTERGFEHHGAVELPGEFSLRGGILDVFAYDWQQPVRIELFDVEIESIRQVDVATQRSLASVDEVEVTALGDLAAEGHLAPYLPDDTWLLVIEMAEAERGAARFRHRAWHTPADVWKTLAEHATLRAWGVSESPDEQLHSWSVGSVERFPGDVAHVRESIGQVPRPTELVIVCQTEAEQSRLRELLQETPPLQDGRLHFTLGRLEHGFELNDPPVVVLPDNELFRRSTLRRAPRRVASKAMDSFLDLSAGDLVVHLSHGIGRFRGIRLLEKGEQVEEHLELEFAEGTRVYVPASKIDLVQKYVGGRKGQPRLARLGSRTWLRQKQAAAAAVTDLAAEMLELHAHRQTQPGIRFAPDSLWQREFDAAFPYQETPDQLSAMEAIKADMQRARPMDRLICGDVGFGKTELAMRAAFKAVDNGFQVAVLVPTTILAEQHYLTFTERMAEYPLVIAKLSRFCTDREQRQIVHALKAGQIDIVIGTHRLASRDVGFQNLGLLIIDEEQRFGVEVKDRLKTLRRTVDVLTLSATPIPRTLHMALTGIRDISNLETPPADRLAVETRVTRWDDNLIREVIVRELSRNGQVFFVHNRVHDIELIAHRLRYIVPEARLGIGHGQMPEGELEQVMVDFVAHRFDVLLATTIIESGLDIPRANTIIIDDAHMYGLADLHQLRGRVGRYKHKAYCYLLVDKGKSLTPQAARRLRAIEEFSDMGAGFAIAMRDLEIRGAGNLLGTQQSGHIAAVGYELYCQLLEAAVRRLRNQPVEEIPEVDIQLPGEAYLPDDYTGDRRTKIDLYRRLARIRRPDEVDQLREELVDRFGPPGRPVERLLALALLRLDAAASKVQAIHWEPPYLVLQAADQQGAEWLARRHGRRLRRVDDQHLYYPVDERDQSAERLLEIAKYLLRSA